MEESPKAIGEMDALWYFFFQDNFANKPKGFLFMPGSEFSWGRIATLSTLSALSTALGTGISAAVRDGSIAESASVVGGGTGLLIAGVGIGCRFGFFDTEPQSIEPIHNITIPATIATFGAAVGYIGTKLFINTAASVEPFIDGAFGLPITVGAFYCSKLLVQAYVRSQNEYNTNSGHALT